MGVTVVNDRQEAFWFNSEGRVQGAKEKGGINVTSQVMTFGRFNSS